jgi:3-oxoacyl-[acyl-carrier protein] reductase
MNCALITGGSKGIGRAIALQLSRDYGLHILVNYSTDTSAANETVEKICNEGGSAEPFKFKVQNKSEVDGAIAAWQQRNPDKFIRVLVNNAAIAKDSLFMWMPESSWDEVMAISLKGMFNVTQSIIRQMLHHKSGRIINIASISGLKGVPGQTNYSAAKAGVIGATKALAQEVAKMNITVNGVAPGFIKTAMTENMELSKYLSVIPMGRIGEPEEIAHIVSFLASEKASYITGEIISVNGGLYS